MADIENIISSDEYSEDEDYINEAQNYCKPESVSSTSSPAKCSDLLDVPIISPQRLQSIKLSLMRCTFLRKPRKHYTSIHKRKAVKWLNNKGQREKYKKYFLSLQQRTALRKRSTTINAYALEPIKSVDIDNNNDDNAEETEEEDEEGDDIDMKENGAISSASSFCNVGIEPTNNVEEDGIKGSQQTIGAATTMESVLDTKTHRTAESIEAMEMKPVEATLTPISTNTSSTAAAGQEELPVPTSKPLYKQINELFPKYDAIIEDHVEINSTSTDIDETIARVALEMHTLNSMVHSTELELNRLLHLTKITEELLSRLMRKKQAFELAGNHNLERCTITELKELAATLAGPNVSQTSKKDSRNQSLNTTLDLIKYRANMTNEDLKLEHNTTDRLHRLLVANNALVSRDDINANRHLSNSNEPIFSKSDSTYLLKEHFDKERNLLNVAHAKKDSLLRELSNRDKKHTSNRHNGNDTTNAGGSKYTPTLERLLISAMAKPQDKNSTTAFAQSSNGNQNDSHTYRLHNMIGDQLCDEVSIIPVMNSDNLSMVKQTRYKMDFPREVSNSDISQNVSIATIGVGKYNSGGNSGTPRTAKVPICQECHAHESEFVCGDCGNQWYCSRRCQITAWDKHSDVCY